MIEDIQVFTKTRFKLLFLCLIFILSLGSRITSLILNPVMMRDSSLYICLADQEIAKGEFLRQLIDRNLVPPLPVFFIQLLTKFGFSAEISGRSVSLFVGSIIPVLGYLITKILLKKELPSLICAVILSFHPYLISYSTQPLRENFYLFFSGFAFVYFLSGIETHKTIKWFICGAFSSLAFFCRYEALEFLFIFPVAFLFVLLFKKRFTKMYFCNIGVFLLSFLFVIFILIHIIGIDRSFLEKVPIYLDFTVITSGDFQSQLTHYIKSTPN